MILEHYRAVENLLPTGLFDVHFGAVQDRVEAGKAVPLRYPYVVLWGDLGSERGESVSGRFDKLELRPRITYVGSGFEQCLWVAQRVRDALRTARPTVAGWAPSRLAQNPLNPAVTDRDVRITDSSGRTSYPVYAVDEFPFTSHKLNP